MAMHPESEEEKKLLDNLVSSSNRTLMYEDPDLQNLALEKIPIETLSENASKKASLSKSSTLGEDDFLIHELLHWYKFVFFTWIDEPKCETCGQPTKAQGYVEPTEADKEWGGHKVENYLCVPCVRYFRFPRYNHPMKLLETRRGRCGEWANCFTLLCRSLGYDARLVLDWGDHLWTEIYSVTQKRWIHCDPCENVCDAPLMYESGWKKTMAYVIAFSKDEVQDVTWRYCTNFDLVLQQRTIYRESWLLSCIMSITNSLQASFSPEEKNHLMLRRLNELTEFLTPPKLSKDSELYGRSSGSQSWRESRGEYNPKPHVFYLSATEIKNEYLNLKYNCALDKYIRVSDDFSEQEHWESFVYGEKNIFRKVEYDWKMAYLARRESFAQGSISWKFDFRDSGLVIDVVTLTLGCATFENGLVKWTLISEDLHVPLKGGFHPVITEELRGCIEFTLMAELHGGNGAAAWQHAQLFRQSLDSMEFPLEIEINFVPRSTAL